MAKNKISEFDVNPDNNTDINNINIAEGCAPSGINNAIRQLMSDLKEFQTGGAGDPFNGAVNGTVGATTPASGAFTTLSATGVSTFSAGTVSAPSITTTGDTNTGIFFPAADTIAFTEGGTESMRIDSSGNVGIGNSSPSQALVVGNGAADKIAIINGKNTGTGGGASLIVQNNSSSISAIGNSSGIVGGAYDANSMLWAANTQVFSVNGSERMRIDSSGNVGIGTASPAVKLQVVDSGTGTNTVLVQSGLTGTTPRSNSVLRLQTTATGRDVNIQFSDNVTNAAEIGMVGGAQYFATGGSERMRLDGAGNFLVGISSAGATGGWTFYPTGSGSSPFIVVNKTNTSSTRAFDFQVSGTSAGSINWTNTATSYLTSSDYRLKENVAPMTGALAKVSALKPVTYTWKSTGEESQGFIAHELAEVVPDCVSGEKDAVDKEGKPVYQGIDTSFLVATLTAAIQELKAEIDALKAQINQ